MAETVYTMQDYRGNPVSVPESKLDEWMAQQEELKANPPEPKEPFKLSAKGMEQFDKAMNEALAQALRQKQSESST